MQLAQEVKASVERIIGSSLDIENGFFSSKGMNNSLKVGILNTKVGPL